MQKYLKEFLKRLFVFVLVAVSIISLGVVALLLGPEPYIYENGDWEGSQYIPTYNKSQGNVLFDPHSHSSDVFTGSLTVEQNLQWHIAMGFNSCVVSDAYEGDNQAWETSRNARKIAREKYNGSIKVLIGVEWHSLRVHMNIILPPDAVQSEYETKIKFYGMQPTDAEIQSVITAVHDLGGVIMIPHLIWSDEALTDHPTKQTFLDWNIDYLQVLEADEFDSSSYDFCEKNGMAMMAATGMHSPLQKVSGYTLINAENFTEDAIFNQLISLNTEILALPGEVPYEFEHKTNWGYHLLRPLIQIGDMFEDYNPSGFNLDYIAFSVFVGYLTLIFFISELLRHWGKKRAGKKSSSDPRPKE
jgi:hypothetical protein